MDAWYHPSIACMTSNRRVSATIDNAARRRGDRVNRREFIMLLGADRIRRCAVDPERN
jgi:hypothetical protein